MTQIRTTHFTKYIINYLKNQPPYLTTYMNDSKNVQRKLPSRWIGKAVFRLSVHRKPSAVVLPGASLTATTPLSSLLCLRRYVCADFSVVDRKKLDRMEPVSTIDWHSPYVRQTALLLGQRRFRRSVAFLEFHPETDRGNFQFFMYR